MSMKFEFLTTDPMSPVTVWLDQKFRQALGDDYALSKNGEELGLPDKALLRLWARHGHYANLSSRDPHPSLVRAWKLQGEGVKVLNPPQAHYIADDKLMSAAVLRANGLPTPAVWDAHYPDGEIAQAEHGWIVKPRWGELGRDVHKYDAMADAMNAAKEADEPQVLQHFLPDARCIRLVASKNRVYTAYEKKMLDGDFVAAISRGGIRVEVDGADYGMDQLAMQAVQVCGADFAGVDILLSESKPYVLELNINPGGLNEMTEGQDQLIRDLLA